MFLGFVSSAKYDSKETLNLEQGRPIEAMGYKLTYVGYQPLERGRFGFNVDVEKDGQRFTVRPVMFKDGGEDGNLIRNPDIVNLLTKDFYLSPLSLEAPDASSSNEVTIFRGKTETFGDLSIRYIDYSFTQSAEKGNYLVMNIEVTRNGKKEIVHPTMINKGGKPVFTEATLTGTNISLLIKGMNPSSNDNEAKVTLAVNGINTPTAAPKPETLVVEASIKPFINLVWIGTFALIGGFLITIVRRIKEVNK